MEHASIDALVEHFLEKTPKSSLSLDDFDHLSREVGELCTLIRNALGRREQGGNILFYGPPGTGKTQLSHLIAETIGCSLYSVRWRDDDHEPSPTTERLMGLELGQNFLGNHSNSFLLFDEVEAIFEGEHDGMGALSRMRACEIPRPQPQQGLDQPDAGYPKCIAHHMDRQ